MISYPNFLSCCQFHFVEKRVRVFVGRGGSSTSLHGHSTWIEITQEKLFKVFSVSAEEVVCFPVQQSSLLMQEGLV